MSFVFSLIKLTVGLTLNGVIKVESLSFRTEGMGMGSRGECAVFN